MPRPAIHRLLILIPVLAVLCFLVGFTHEKPTITAAPSEVGRVAPNAPSAIAPSHNTSHLTPATYVTYNYEAPGQPHRPHDAAPTYDYEPSHDFSGSLALSTADSPTDYIPSRPRSIRPQAQANAPNSQNYTYDASGILNAAENGVARQTTILGENVGQRVAPFAQRTGARDLGFGATQAEWNAMTPAQRWKLNDGMLRARINEGDAFRYIGQDPLRNPALRTQFDLTGSELLRLNGRGIPYEVVSPSEVMSVLGRP